MERLGYTKSYQGCRHTEKSPRREAGTGQPSASQGQASEELTRSHLDLGFPASKLCLSPVIYNVCYDSPRKVIWSAAAAAKSLQSCPTLCNPIDGGPLGSLVPGIVQARILEWGAISFSNAWKWKVKVRSLSHARLLATPWTAAYQAPPSMGFSR